MFIFITEILTTPVFLFAGNFGYFFTHLQKTGNYCSDSMKSKVPLRLKILLASFGALKYKTWEEKRHLF